MFRVRNLTVEVGGHEVVHEASFDIYKGNKVGLVGRNGAGKTSLLRVLAKERTPLRGLITHTGDIGYVSQDSRAKPRHPHTTALAHVLSGRGMDEAVDELERLRMRLVDDSTGEAVEEYIHAEERYRTHGGYSAESDARKIATSIGVGNDRLDLHVSALSGGERRRVELARVLFQDPPVLLLDEPTNHLDVGAKTWLMQFLRTYRGALLVVSHDLELLDEAITRVLHLDEGKMVEYKGTYSQYVAARAADEGRQVAVAERQEKEISRLRTLADSMRHSSAKRARVAKTLDKRTERMEKSRIAAPRKQRRVSPHFPPPPHSGRILLEIADIMKSFGGPPILNGITFELQRKERVLILGENGAGKTTLLRIITGELQQDSGTVEKGYESHIGYYSQEHEGIQRGVDVLTHMRQASNVPDSQLRAILGMFGLTGDKAGQDATTLSGGEKTRLVLAQLVGGNHNALLLDEPTNNLDPPSRSAVAKALAAWGGAMLIVSHDTEFVKELAPDRVVVMPDGLVDYWSDDMLDLVSIA